MLGLEALEMLTEDVLLTGYLADERAVSMILIAPPGLGKSELVMQYRNSPGVLLTTETTFFSLMLVHGVAIQQRQVHHVIMPDLGPLVNKPREGAMRELSQFGALVAEGLMNWRSSRGAFATGNQPVRCGMIFCITPYSYREKLSLLADEGFLSRFLVASFSVHEHLKRRVHEQISTGEVNSHIAAHSLQSYQNLQTIRLDPKVDRFLSSSGIIDQIRDTSDTAGFRMHHQLRALLKANALRRGSPIVSREDLNDLDRMLPYLGANLRSIGEGV